MRPPHPAPHANPHPNRAPERKAVRDPVAKALFVLIGLFAIALGIAAIWTGHVPERATRYGHAGALDDTAAIVVGIVHILLGLIPISAALLSDRYRVAAIVFLGMAVLATIPFGISPS